MSLHLEKMTTRQMAEMTCYKHSTIITRLCKTGSFYGIKPIKLPSGRLLWAANEVQALLTGKES